MQPLVFSLTAVGFAAQTEFTLERYRGASLEQLRRRASRQALLVAGRLTREQFRGLLEVVARGWNNCEAAMAAACFAEDAVYVEPPDRQLYRGRDELFEFFGGDDPPPMTMSWHHVVFDEATQLGAAEYTFEGRRQYHGVVLVQLDDGLIARCREYQYESPLEWDEFVGPSRFSV